MWCKHFYNYIIISNIYLQYQIDTKNYQSYIVLLHIIWYIKCRRKPMKGHKKMNFNLNTAVRQHRLTQCAKAFHDLTKKYPYSYDNIGDYYDRYDLYEYDEKVNVLYTIDEKIVEHYGDVIENNAEEILTTLEYQLKHRLDDGTDEYNDTYIVLENIRQYCSDYQTLEYLNMPWWEKAE